MPIYEFKRISTGEIFEEIMSMSAMEEFVKDDDIEKVVSAAQIISGIPGITHKNDGGFKDLMSRVADANPNSPLADEHGKKDVKSSKLRDVAKKHNMR